MLNWQAPKDNGGSPVIGYEYRQRRENEKFDDTWIWVDGDGEARETTVTDLENGVTYSFQVRAVNKKLGAGDPSNEAGATTLKPGVTLVTPASSVEEGEDAVFILSRMDRLTRELTVDVSLAENGDVLVDGYQAPAQVTFPAGEQEVRLEIATENDALDETDGALTLTLVEGDDYEAEAPGTAVVAVRDNDDAPQLTVEAARAAEDEGVMVFLVNLSAPSTLPITVEYATSDGTATAGEDYTAADGSLTFMPGETERTTSVLVQEDTIYEGDETFVLTLSNPENAELANAAATGTIADNDAMPELTVADARASEDAGMMVFSVKLSGPSALPITVDYATSDGTATAGADYTATDGSLKFIAGETERTISVLLQEDEMYEGDETFVLTLSNPENADLANAAATGTIADNDAMPELTVADARASEDAGVMVFSVNLNAPGALPVTVNYATSDGTATAGEDYTAADGNLSFIPGDIERTIRILLQEDEIFEGDETFSLTLSNPVNAGLADAEATGTIVNDDDNSAGALAWLSRFGRTVATQVVDTLESRFYGAFTDEKSVTLGGLQMRPGLAPALTDEQALGWHADMAFIHGAGLD